MAIVQDNQPQPPPGPPPQPPPGAGRHLRTIGRGASWVFVGEVVKNALRYLGAVLVGRSLGAATFGDFGLLMTLERFTQIFADAGLPQANLKFIPRALAHDDEAGARRIARLTAAVSLLFGSGLLLLLWVLAPAIASGIYHRPDLVFPLRLVAASMPLASMAWTVLTVSQARRNVLPIVLNQRIGVPVLFLAGTVAVIYWQAGLTALVWAYLLANAIGFVAALFAMVKWFLGTGQSPTHDIPLRELLGFALMTCLGALGRLCLNMADVLVLGRYVPAAELGAYVAASRTAIFILLPINCINPLLAPVSSDLFSRGDIAGLGETYRTTTRWITGAALAISAPMFVAPTFVMRLFGEDFRQGSAVLLAIAAGQFINGATGCVAFLMLVTGGHTAVAYLNAVAVIFMVGGLVFAGQAWGIIGAAVCVGVVVGAVNIAQVIWLWRRLRIQPYDRLYWTCLLISGGLLLAAAWVGTWGAMPAGVALAVFYVALGVVTYHGWGKGGRAILSRRQAVATVPAPGDSERGEP